MLLTNTPTYSIPNELLDPNQETVMKLCRRIYSSPFSLLYGRPCKTVTFDVWLLCTREGIIHQVCLTCNNQLPQDYKCPAPVNQCVITKYTLVPLLRLLYGVYNWSRGTDS